jgi:phosphoglycerate dehydrogenase-like enzyme
VYLISDCHQSDFDKQVQATEAGKKTQCNSCGPRREIQRTRKSIMKKIEEIHNIVIVGTGVIGASWAAYYLSRGFSVVATDPAPNAEASLRK